MFSTRMKLLYAVILDHDAESVSKELLNKGLLHFVKTSTLSGEENAGTTEVYPEADLEKLAKIRKRLESFLGQVKVDAGRELDIRKLGPVNIENIEKTVDELALKIEGIREKQKQIQQEIMKTLEIKRQLDLDSPSPDLIKTDYSYLKLRLGSLSDDKVPIVQNELKSFPCIFQESAQTSGKIFMVLFMKKDCEAVDRILQQYGWSDSPPTVPGEDAGIRQATVKSFKEKISTLTNQQKEYEKMTRKYIQENSGAFLDYWERIRLNELNFNIQTYFSRTSKTMLFSGWMPASKQKLMEKTIRKAAKNQCYLEWANVNQVPDALKKSVPVELKAPAFLSPFRMLVRNYATPQYGTINPIPFTALFYLIMFALMFQDAGHGLVLFLIGFLGFLNSSKKDTKNLFLLIVYCGTVSIISGIVFGSYFGMPWFKPLWFNYHGIVAGHSAGSGFVKDIYSILSLTLYFGIVVISLGIVLNWINCLRNKEWFRLVFHKAGLIGAVIYGGGVYTAFTFLRSGYSTLPSSRFLLFFFGIPAFLLLFKAPVKNMINKKKEKFRFIILVNFFMEWFVEILEIFSGYLANTLSFMRVAGLGIAHVSLMIAFFTIAAMTGPNPNFLGIIIILFGNLLVILLEGLSAGIQALRLNYYEFFSKYFTGSGHAYEPISLKIKQSK